MTKYSVILLFLLLLQGCVAAQQDISNKKPDLVAPLAAAIEQAKLRRTEITTGPFILTTYARINDRAAPVTIYIEGEDQPFATSAAIEPTPKHPVGLILATLDPATNVVYIARPCQFTVFDPACAPELVQNGRYASQVVASVNRAINHVIVPLEHPRIHLVGYGGGGAVAALIAANRVPQADVASLRTVAGNLDPEGLARYEGYDGADDLLDPMPVARKLVSIPQEHFVGSDDTLIPPFLVRNFIDREHHHGCAVLTTEANVGHVQGWEQIWTQRAIDLPRCGKTLR